MFEGAQDTVTEVSPDYCPPGYDGGYGEIPDWAPAVTYHDALVYYLPGYSEYPLSTAPTNSFSPAFESLGYEYSPFRRLPLETPPPNNSAGSPQDFDRPVQSGGFGLPSPQHPVLHSTLFPSSSHRSPSSSYQSPETAVSSLQPWPVSPMGCPVHHDSHNHQQTTAILSSQPREVPGSTEATRPRAIENATIADPSPGRTAVQSTRRQVSMS